MRGGILGLVLAIIATSALVADDRSEKPFPLADYIAALSSPDQEVRAKACTELGQRSELLSPAIPEFALAVDNQDLKEKLLASRRELKSHVKLITAALDSRDRDVVVTAASLLAVLGPEERDGFKRVLARMDRCGDEESLLRLQLAMSSVALRPAHQPASPGLLDAALAPKEAAEMWETLKDYDPLSKDGLDQPGSGCATGLAMSGWLFATILANCDRTTVEIPALLEAARPDKPRARRLLALMILANFEEEARPAAADLKKLLRDPDRLVAYLSACALLSARCDGAQIPDVAKELRLTPEQQKVFDENIAEGEKTAERDAKSRHENPSSVIDDALPRIRNSPISVYRRSALRQLRDLGPAAREALPTVRELLKDPNEQTRTLAAETIRKIEANTTR